MDHARSISQTDIAGVQIKRRVSEALGIDVRDEHASPAGGLVSGRPSFATTLRAICDNETDQECSKRQTILAEHQNTAVCTSLHVAGACSVQTISSLTLEYLLHISLRCTANPEIVLFR